MKSWIAGMVLALAAPLLAGEPGKAEAENREAVRSLADFGPIGSPQEAKAAFEKAVEALGKMGGILLIPSPAARFVLAENTSQIVERTPPPPAPSTTWHDGPGITIVDVGETNVTVRVPPLDGLRLSRTLRMPPGTSLPHWSTNPVLSLESHLVYGSISYLDWLQAPVQRGADRRFYVATIRGIRPGQFLNIHGGPGYGGGVARAYVKAVGYDRERRMHYFVADTTLDHVAGAIVHNKNNTGLLSMAQTSHNDNQTYDVRVIRNQYAHGDTYIYYCDFNYMSNVHSAAGDENGNCYAAFIRSKSNNFRGAVEAVDWAKQQLKFAPNARNVETLGDSRPLINRNPKKWVTAGKVLIVPAESRFGAGDAEKFPLDGKTYPSRIVKDPASGAGTLRMGGLIRGDRDCPWTRDVIGRFFAVTDEAERIPGGNLRWYEITSLAENPDGTKDIEVRRFWWGARSMGSPTLYSPESYSWDGHLRPLTYAIAPGTYANDVSYAVAGGRGGQRLLGLAPYCDQGTAFDFGPGDEIEQAVGPDPFKPQAFRVWMWEDVPGPWPSCVFDLANLGAASRYAAMNIRGGPATLEEAEKRQEKRPAWDNFLVFESAATVGINCQADFADAAILFQQPNHEQPIKWHYGREPGKAPKEATLTVGKSTGALTFHGGGLCLQGGLSGTDEPARNLRGKAVPVQEGATSTAVAFPVPEKDADYAVFVEQSWLTNRAVSEKTPTGFTIQFDKPATAGSRLDWMIVR